jgi:hypothetical protein
MAEHLGAELELHDDVHGYQCRRHPRRQPGGGLPTASMETDRLVIEKTHHQYDSFYRRDALHFHATKATYRNLGLLPASVLFAPNDREVTLSLAHPASAIRRIVVRASARREVEAPGFHSRPLVLNHWPGSVAKHPWYGTVTDSREFPAFLLTNAEECLSRESEWEERDTLIGFGTNAGSARFIELLLNASSPPLLSTRSSWRARRAFVVWHRSVARCDCGSPGASGGRKSSGARTFRPETFREAIGEVAP